ncbi:uncharacterized protein BKA78DRAFT_32642 [Phyllosticta capitalensis]|uniref:uncharacterized protein n=1 Tax=Phyllosticta capitalensis TaxID=121624 RepID=UPI00312D342B
MPPQAPSGTKTKATTTNNTGLDHAPPAPAPIPTRESDKPNPKTSRPKASPQHQQQPSHPSRRHRQQHHEQKQPPSKSKPARIPLDDGWTLVATTHKMSRFRISDLAATHTPNGPAPVMPGTSKEKLLERFAAYRERWRESVCVNELRELLERADLDVQRDQRLRSRQQQQRQGGEGAEQGEEQGECEMENSSGARKTIENAVVLGLGSLSIDNIAGGVRSMWQLVCFLEMVALLSSNSEETYATKTARIARESAAMPRVHVYAEDPVFNSLDEEVLADLGIEIVRPRKGGAGAIEEEGGSAQLIGSASFVFAPFMPSFVMMEEFLSERDPLVYVGNDIAGMLELGRSQLKYSSSGADGDAHRTRKCIAIAEAFLSPNRGVATMPEFDLHPHALAGQMIYWRRPAAAAAASDG